MNLVALIVLFAGTVYSWSGPSHIIIYMIARKEIGEKQTALVDKIIAELPEPDVNYKNPYEIAMWPDDLKSYFKGLNGFHFYDQLFYDGIDPKDVTAVVDPVYNVANAVIICYNTLKHKAPFPFHFDGRFEKSFALRYLIHTVGDLHQPLHAASRCTKQKPGCDGGGNGFKIKKSAFTNNLHALWDHVMDLIPFESRPLTQKGIGRYQARADEITKQFPRSSLAADLAIKDIWEIARKNFEIAVNYAYKDIRENEEPSEQYIKSRYEICKRQIALAGYRLADMLKEIVYSEAEAEAQ